MFNVKKKQNKTKQNKKQKKQKQKQNKKTNKPTVFMRIESTGQKEH